MDEVKHHFSDGLYAKEAHIPAGYSIGKHVHAYSHLSILAIGYVQVTAGDEMTEYIGPACVEIKAGVEHTIKALSDSVWFCIHATDEKDGGAIDAVLIKKGD